MSDHYHISNGTELTLAASREGVEIAVNSFKREAMIPSVAGIVVRERHTFARNAAQNDIVVEHPETETTIIRVRVCDDPTCEAALADHWL